MKNEIYNKNLCAIGNWVDSWKDYIEKEKYQLNQEYKIEIETSKCGDTIFTIENSDSRRLYLSGKYNPRQGIQDWIKRESIRRHNSIIIVLGLGDYIEVEELMRATEEDTYILVYEPLINVFIKSVQEIDMTQLFSQKRIGLVIKEMNEEEWERILESILEIENVSLVHIFLNQNYKEFFGDDIYKILYKTSRIIQNLKVRWNTRIRYTANNGLNMLKNIKYLINESTINGLYGILPQNIPCVIVAAGPSLNKNIKDLKRIKKRACIIACDTAIKPLLSNGIIPDFFVVVDAKKPLKLIEYPGSEKISLVTGLNTPNDIMEYHKGRKFFYYEGGLLIKKMVDEGLKNRKKPVPIKEGMSFLKTGGSVATSAYSFAECLGSRIFILVGQDLSFPDGKSHADGTFAKKMEKIEGIETFPVVSDINGDPVHTALDMLAYLQWYEEEFKQHSDYKIIDATEGGALIAGTEVMGLRDAIDKYCIEDVDIQGKIKTVPNFFDDEEKEMVYRYLEKIPQLSDITLKMIQNAKEMYQKLMMLTENEEKVSDDIRCLVNEISEITDKLEKNEIYQLMVGFMAGYEYTYRASIYQQDETRELYAIARQGENYLDSMEYILKEMIPILCEEFNK